MKRDMDLIREILQTIEASPGFGPTKIEIEGRTEEEVAYHRKLLEQAGFIDASTWSLPGGKARVALPITLTWEGHEFLEASRDDGMWKKAKDTTVSKAGGLMFDVLKAVLVEMAKRAALGAIT